MSWRSSSSFPIVVKGKRQARLNSMIAHSTPHKSYCDTFIYGVKKICDIDITGSIICLFQLIKKSSSEPISTMLSESLSLLSKEAD